MSAHNPKVLRSGGETSRVLVVEPLKQADQRTRLENFRESVPSDLQESQEGL